LFFLTTKPTVYITNYDSACNFFNANFSENERTKRIELLDQSTLDLSNSLINSAIIDFNEMTYINTLVLSHCRQLESIRIENGDNIKELYLSHINGKLKEVLSACANLELLGLTNVNLNVADLSAIKECLNLRIISLDAYVPYVRLFCDDLDSLLIDVPEVHLSNFSFLTYNRPLKSNKIVSLSLRNSAIHYVQLIHIILASEELKFLDLDSCASNLIVYPRQFDNPRISLERELLLETVHLNNVPQYVFMPAIFLIILKNSPNLKCLKLLKCDFLIKVLNEALTEKDCLSHNVEEIDFTDCSSLTDEVLNKVLLYFPRLKYLTIRNCKEITQHAFENIDLSGFITLDLTGCNQISDDYLKEIFATMEKLQCLIIEGRRHIKDDVFDNAYFPNLLSVSLRDCVFLSDKCLSSLFIATCNKVSDEDSPVISIRNINIRNCRLITGSGLNQDAFNIGNLTCLIMRDCVNFIERHYIQIKQNMAEEHAIDTIGCDRLPKAGISDVVSPSLTYFGVSNTFDYFLRWLYISKDENIVKVAREGLEEAIVSRQFEDEYIAAAYAIMERNMLKDQIRRLGDPVDKILFEERNLLKYCDKLGPGPEKLLGTKEEYLEARLNNFSKVSRKGCMSAEEAINSAARTNQQITDMANKRFLTGALFLSVESILMWRRVNQYENKVYGLTSELSGKIGAFVLIRALGSMSVYCSTPIGYLAAIGTIAEILLAMGGDIVGKRMHGYVYKPISKQVWGTYVFWHKPNIQSDFIVPLRKGVKERKTYDLVVIDDEHNNIPDEEETEVFSGESSVAEKSALFRKSY